MQLIDWPFRVVEKACWSSWSFEMDKKNGISSFVHTKCATFWYISVQPSDRLDTWHLLHMKFYFIIVGSKQEHQHVYNHSHKKQIINAAP
jgi:hypothetical protein